jgi:hypothetical protein
MCNSNFFEFLPTFPSFSEQHFVLNKSNAGAVVLIILGHGDVEECLML